MRRRSLAILAHGAQSLLLCATFAGAIVGGVLLHANTPAFRRLTARIGGAAANAALEGSLVVQDVQSIELGSSTTVRLRQVDVLDPEERLVLRTNDVQATLDLRRLLTALAVGKLVLVLDDVRLGPSEIMLYVDSDDKALSLARAFKPRSTSDDAPPEFARAKPTVHVKGISLARLRVQGELSGTAIDGEVEDVRAAVTLVDDMMTATLDRTRISVRSPRAPEQKAPLLGEARGQLNVDLAEDHVAGEIDFRGSCGAIPVLARGKIDGDDVDVTLDVPETSPETIAATIVGSPLRSSLELHTHAHGKLPTLEIDTRVRLGDSKLTVNAELDLREGNAFKIDVDATDIDADAFGAGVTTRLSGKLHGEGVLGTAPFGRFRMTTTEGEVGGERIPAATIDGRFEDQRVTAIFRAFEPGIEANGKVSFDAPKDEVTFDLQARSNSLRALTRIPNKLGGAASLRAQGKLDLARSTVQSTVTASADDLTAGPFSSRRLSASGVLSGPVSAPVLDVGFAGVDMVLSSEGKTPLVYPSATGHAKVALVPTPRLLQANIDIGQKGTSEVVTASVRGVSFANGVVEARGVRVTGLGDPVELDARVQGPEWHVRAKSAGIDIRKAADLTGIQELEALPEGTRAELDVDLSAGGEGPSGHFDVAIRNERGGLDGGALAVEVHAKIERGKLIGDGRLSIDGLGHVGVDAELDAPARFDGKSLERITGVIELRGLVDLSRGAAVLASDKLERTAGKASFEARIERGDPSSLPAIRATVRTEGLELAVSDPERRNAPPLEVKGIDVLTHVAWDGRTQDAEASVLTWDHHGLLGHASVKTTLPLVAWAKGEAPIDATAIARLNVQGLVSVPSRNIAELPPFLGLPTPPGQLGGRVQISGPLGHPTVFASVQVKGLSEERRATGVETFAPLDGTLEAHWQDNRAAITFSLDERERQLRTGSRSRTPNLPSRPERTDAGQSASVSGSSPNRNAPPSGSASSSSSSPARRTRKEPGHLRGLVLVTDVRADDFLHGKTLSDVPWRASTEIEVKNLALGALPLPTRVTGALTARVRLKNLNHEPSFEAKAHVDNLAVEGARVQSFDLTAGGRDASLFAHAVINDKTDDDETRITMQLASKSLRMKGLDVSWDADAPSRLDYAVQNGRLALLAPFVKNVVSSLDGRIDGAGSATIDGASQVFEGGLALQNANVYVNALGEEITSLNATAKFDRTGVFRIDDAAGKIGDGEFQASASGRMLGFRFAGIDATAIATKDGVPISAEGATFAKATGEVKISAIMSADRSTLNASVDVPRADVELPDRGTQSLQSLDADPKIAIGVRRGSKLDTGAVRKNRGGTGSQRTTVDGAPALVTRMTVSLGANVQLQGRGIRVKLGGRTLVEIADEIRVTGRIDLRGGTIEAHGRRFTVDHGTVTFPEGDDPTNPTVIAAAYWDAPDRTRVWVEFMGPIKTGNLTLRSEPAYSKTEILSILLFGRPDPNAASADASGNGNDAAGATAIGSGLVAGDLNRALSEFDEDLDFETDTLSGNRTRIKVGRSFFDRRLKVQIAPTLGRATYREPDTTYIFLNWQFIPKWTLIATRGDRGTSILDVLFQHRY